MTSIDSVDLDLHPTERDTEDEIMRHPQPIEPSLPPEVRPRTDPEAAPFVPPPRHHTVDDVSPGLRTPPPARPRQPSIDSISRADDEGMTAPPSRETKV